MQRGRVKTIRPRFSLLYWYPNVRLSVYDNMPNRRHSVFPIKVTHNKV